jgi:hypothetical protein
MLPARRKNAPAARVVAVAVATVARAVISAAAAAAAATGETVAAGVRGKTGVDANATNLCRLSGAALLLGVAPVVLSL